MEGGTSSSRSTTQACAACKYQRRKCGPTCILAPFFPHYRQKQFLHAHRLFGVGKIINMIKPLDPVNRNSAINTIIYESDMRARNPVGGCLSFILHLQSLIVSAESELQFLLQHLAFFRAQLLHSTATPQPPPPPPSSSSYDPYLPQMSLQESKDPSQLHPQQLGNDPLQLQQQEQPKDPCFNHNSSFNYYALQEDMSVSDIDNLVHFFPWLPPQDDTTSQYRDP
ncbi:LOB domain-containing protein 22-like [Vigna unguiculata]|uniref:Carbamoyl-phosphate synthase large subunit n=1 Tax=Vigna unguiculata TaxID=3917 RepID=A0A4D6N708_VIGUN|nr:LOB domain-containing protein 22-like [Vigna unguiculata]QCE09058.1 carbamoyl-phosphate synthase large subunit [Vigna unguiculata]